MLRSLVFTMRRPAARYPFFCLPFHTPAEPVGMAMQDCRTSVPATGFSTVFLLRHFLPRSYALLFPAGAGCSTAGPER